MNDLQAPWVGNAPCEEERTEYCPCCNKECEEYYISKDTGEIVGCEHCLKRIDSWEWED